MDPEEHDRYAAAISHMPMILSNALFTMARGSKAWLELSRMAGPENGLTWLIAARVVQGFGGGALVPLSMALASHLFRGRARAAALGVPGKYDGRGGKGYWGTGDTTEGIGARSGPPIPSGSQPVRSGSGRACTMKRFGALPT